jgi:hypothetical protein
MAQALILLSFLVIVGCDVKGDPFVPKEQTDSPHGWVDYCKRTPTDPDCK